MLAKAVKIYHLTLKQKEYMNPIQRNQHTSDTTVRSATAFRRSPKANEEIVLTQANHSVLGRWSSTFLRGFVALLALSSKGVMVQGSLTRCTSGSSCSSVPEYAFNPNYVNIKQESTSRQEEQEVQQVGEDR